MQFTIQLEVAERLVARPRTKDYGVLTLLTQPFYEIRIARKIPSSVFWPKPEVDSAVVTLIRRVEPVIRDDSEERLYRQMIKKAFQQRRKTLGSIFKKDLPTGFESKARPEELGIGDWARFARAFSTAQGGQEMFDVVDSKDRVISQQLRHIVHRDRLLHRAVHIFVWNQHGELLLQMRASQKDVAPNTWDSSAAGHLDVGEEYDRAAHREVGEELGISVSLEPLRKFEACASLGWEFVWLYKGVSEGPFQFPSEEISEIKWWKPALIDRAIQDQPSLFAPSFRYIWGSFLDRNGLAKSIER
jgi:16S rRNA (adenine1518-N6/adenine1519-N6)-dimethyltransferase